MHPIFIGHFLDTFDLPTHKLLIYWRPQGDSNPCYRRERAVTPEDPDLLRARCYAQLVKVVGPRLDHLAALSKSLGAIVSRTNFVSLFMREL